MTVGFICLFITTSASVATATGSVVTIDSAEAFTTTVMREQLWVVKFYAPWCGHCKRLAPIFEEVATETQPDVARFAKIDCDKQKSARINLCSDHGVKGFPMVKVMHEGLSWEYRGPRTKDGLNALVERMRSPAIREVKSAADLEDAMKNVEIKFTGTPVIFLGAYDGDKEYSAFGRAARMLQHKDTFVASNKASVLAAIGKHVVGAMPETPFVTRLELGEAPQILSGADAVSVEAISAFIDRERLPTLSVIDQHNFYDLSNAGKTLILLYAQSPITGAASLSLADSEVAEALPTQLRALARDAALRSSLVFGLLDAKQNAEHVSEAYKIPSGSEPLLIALKRHKGYRSFAVSTPGDCESAAAMRDYLERVASGEVQFEYEGLWGAPDRWWRFAKSHVPQLAALDFMPRFSLLAFPGALLILVIVKLLLYEPLTSQTVTEEDVAREYKSMAGKKLE